MELKKLTQKNAMTTKEKRRFLLKGTTQKKDPPDLIKLNYLTQFIFEMLELHKKKTHLI